MWDWPLKFFLVFVTATKSLGPSGVVQAFLENEKDILNTAGPDNKFPGANLGIPKMLAST